MASEYGGFAAIFCGVLVKFCKVEWRWRGYRSSQLRKPTPAPRTDPNCDGICDACDDDLDGDGVLDVVDDGTFRETFGVGTLVNLQLVTLFNDPSRCMLVVNTSSNFDAVEIGQSAVVRPWVAGCLCDACGACEDLMVGWNSILMENWKRDL